MKSDLFMKYIIQQIKHFSAGLTDKMLEVEYFNHIPNQRTPSQERMRGGSMLTTAQAMNKGWCLLLEVGGLGLGVEFLFYQFHDLKLHQFQKYYFELNFLIFHSEFLELAS